MLLKSFSFSEKLVTSWRVSLTLAVTSFAIGASLTGLTVIVAVAMLVLLEFLLSVASNVNVSVPFQSASGVYDTVLPLLNVAVPFDGALIIEKV